MSTTSSSPTPSPTTSAPPSSPTGSSGSAPQNSPLLFFVALGFGVVFTNLWIIVGVKYCFRYNARNRRQNDENGEPIDLANMPQHRRRRREKKLMTLDEVNERFPILKYKTWVSSRAARGLPTEGGVSQSRAASIRDAEGTIEPVGESSKSMVNAEVASTTEVPEVPQPSSPTTSTVAKETLGLEVRSIEYTAEGSAKQDSPEHVQAQVHDHDHSTPDATTRAPASADGTEEDEDAIAPAVPGAAEMLEAPGDSCAICIDTLEEDDDVRGLSCGHAFHATCIDPWLTNRRACCPLCKADYYVPKARPEQTPQDGANGDERGAGAQTFEQMQTIRRPSVALTAPAGGISRYLPTFSHMPRNPLQGNDRSRSRPNTDMNTGNDSAENTPAAGGRFTSIFRRGATRDNSQEQQISQYSETAPVAGSQPTQRRWRAPSLPSWRRGHAQGPEQTTPSQLEAGNTTNTS